MIVSHRTCLAAHTKQNTVTLSLVRSHARREMYVELVCAENICLDKTTRGKTEDKVAIYPVCEMTRQPRVGEYVCILQAGRAGHLGHRDRRIAVRLPFDRRLGLVDNNSTRPR